MTLCDVYCDVPGISLQSSYVGVLDMYGGDFHRDERIWHRMAITALVSLAVCGLHAVTPAFLFQGTIILKI